MKQLPIAIVLMSLLLLNGCGESRKEHDAKVAQEAREALLQELKVKEKAAENKKEELEGKQSKLSQMGFQKSSDGKIIIDMNQTKNYFQMLAHKMQSKVEQMHKELENGTIEEEEAGIEVNRTHINIDLNKTRHFLDNLGKKMQGYVKDFEGMVQELNCTK